MGHPKLLLSQRLFITIFGPGPYSMKILDHFTMFIYEIFFAKIIFWLKLDSNLGQLELPQEDALDHWASELVINFGRTLEI